MYDLHCFCNILVVKISKIKIDVTGEAMSRVI